MRSKGKRKPSKNSLSKILYLFLFFVLIFNANTYPFYFKNLYAISQVNNRELYDSLEPNFCIGAPFYGHYLNNRLYSQGKEYFYVSQTEDHKYYQEIFSFINDSDDFHFGSISGNSKYIFSLARFNDSNHLFVIDPNNLTNENFVPALSLDSMGSIVVDGERVYVRVGSDHIYSLDITDPNNVIPTSSFSYPFFRIYRVIDRSLYVINRDGELNIRNFGPPYGTGFWNTSDLSINDIYIQDNRLYLVDGMGYQDNDNGIYILNISSKNNPQLIKKYILPFTTKNAETINVYNNHAYVTTNDEVYVFDISDLENIVQRDYFDLNLYNYPGGFEKTFIIGHYLYVLMGNQCGDRKPLFLTFDISNPAKLKRFYPTDYKKLDPFTKCWIELGVIGASIIFSIIVITIVVLRINKKRKMISKINTTMD